MALRVPIGIILLILPHKTNSTCSNEKLSEYKLLGIGSSINLMASSKLFIASCLVAPKADATDMSFHGISHAHQEEETKS